MEAGFGAINEDTEKQKKFRQVQNLEAINNYFDDLYHRKQQKLQQLHQIPSFNG